MSFNPVVRVDPNRMVRVNRTTMQGSFFAGNQRPGVKSAAQQRRLPKPAARAAAPPKVPSSEPTKNPVVTIEHGSADDFDDAQLKTISVQPASLTITRGQPIVITVDEPDAFNIEWYAFSSLNDDTRRVYGGTIPYIEDFPTVDTTYEVRYQVRKGDNLRMRIVGERYRATIRVLDNPHEPTSGLRLAETGNGLANVVTLIDGAHRAVQWSSYRVANRGKVPLDEIYVQVHLPEPDLMLHAPEAKRHAPNVAWSVDRATNIASMRIGDLGVGEAVDVAIAVLLDEPHSQLTIDRVRAWSETEERAQAAVGLQRLEK